MLYALLKRLTRLLSRLPWTVLRRAALVAAFFFWHLAPARRREAVQAVHKHLKVSDEEAVRIARQSFRENFLSFLEILHVGRFFTAQSVRVVHHPEIKVLLEQETQPIIIVTAHLGSWELMAGLSTDLLPRRKGMVVVRSRRNRALNRLMAELRGACGVEVVDHRRASAIVLPGLRQGSVAAFLADHNAARKEAVFLPFLEDIAAVNMGPAGMALRTKAAVYPVFLLRDGKGGHILHFFPPLYTENLEGSIRERIRAIAAFYTDVVADMVRMYPEQWFWMHRRWKTRPYDDDGHMSSVGAQSQA
ncbi:MAG: lysophospholipid acyltransferase family protein [Desulfovibrio sp.]|jgi:KDO2-lipid IV(A) lauroyltransferase|nr:lysophospholipid acyltransferase family protein [Desulfovibrio sp.]